MNIAVGCTEFGVGCIIVDEAPKDLTLNELEEIVNETKFRLQRDTGYFWNPRKGYYEDPAGGRLMNWHTEGYVKLGLFKKYYYELEYDLVKYNGKIKIRKNEGLREK
jgi:hypothetical protein